MHTPTPLPPAVVLVDDEPDVRIILRRLLAPLSEGYELVAVGSGAAVLAVLAERSVPLLITDYNMPGMNGLELVQRVKAAAPTTMIVVASAYATPELAKRAQLAGADYFIPKPFVFEQVEAIVQEALF
ncbi:MAG TPA: response regulator [Roseiflexaceae bacterium]|nr:response regulator [Roseiflexaceae bacterium]